MSRSDEERRAHRARRAQRLAERAEQRAQRRAERARRAAERAERLAERARTSDDDRARPIEEHFDQMAERLERKAETWFGQENVGGRSERRRRRRANRHARHSARAARRRARSLYRDKRRGKILGVCAGLADYLGFDTWKVRLVAVVGLIFLPSFIIPAYLIAYFLLDNKPYYREVTDRYEEPEEAEVTDMSEPDPAEPLQDFLTNTEAFLVAKQKFADVEGRLRDMESHVTSSRFELQRELKKISGDDP